MRVPVSPGVAKKNSFLLKYRLLAVLHLRLLLRKILRNWVQEEVVVITVMPRFLTGEINNNLLFICIDFSHLKFSKSLNSVKVAVLCA